jgi:hypothetical protein
LSAWIGADPSSGGRWYFNGYIDDVRVYKEALSSFEIQQHYAKEAKNYGVATK